MSVRNVTFTLSVDTRPFERARRRAALAQIELRTQVLLHAELARTKARLHESIWTMFKEAQR